MRKISVWAALNPWKTRLIIVLGHILLGLFALYIGEELRELDILLPKAFLLIPILVFLSTVFVYPSVMTSRYIGTVSFRFLIRKTCDGLIIACSFATMIYIFNQVHLLPARFASYATLPYKDSSIQKKRSAQEILASLQYRDKKSLTNYEKRVLKKEFRKQVKIYSDAKLKKAEEKSNKALKIILVILLALGLTFLLAWLACAISCGGAEILALIIGLAGLIGIIWLTIHLIKRINKGKRPSQSTGEEKKTEGSG
jgi:hypothetical protein